MIYELRVYSALPGRREAMLTRFRDHTTRLFEKHGMRNIGYWTNYAGGRYGELVYLLAFEDVAQRERAWAAFSADPRVAHRVRGLRARRAHSEPQREPSARADGLLAASLTQLGPKHPPGTLRGAWARATIPVGVASRG